MVQCDLFGHGVGGHDRVRGVGTTDQTTGELVHDLGDPGQHPIHRQSVPDQSGGTDGDFDRAGVGAPVREGGRHRLGGRVAVGEPFRAGAGIGAAGVQQHRAQSTGAQHLRAPQHRGSLDLIAGEDRGRGVVRPLVEDQCQIRSA